MPTDTSSIQVWRGESLTVYKKDRGRRTGASCAAPGGSLHPLFLCSRKLASPHHQGMARLVPLPSLSSEISTMWSRLAWRLRKDGTQKWARGT